VTPTDSDPRSSQGYRVLARKYRPQSFAELIGQEAVVRTFGNAIASGRLAQAYILTGVRGVGKTTTARIIARALNCIGPDGTGGPTASPCGVCDNCVAIAADRHVDVQEMDAASRTGIDDIRELIEGVRYAPVQARTKIYIIDEVHMLSRQAFNGLLKTLEEPPPHVKFIFATTEVRKIPVTVLSRCQRFDLRRVDAPTLTGYFQAIVEQEGVTVEPEAMAMIVRAAEGSVRDGLSLLDQAIAHGGGAVGAAQVRDMLGLADRAQVIDLMAALMAGDLAATLGLLRRQYDAGAEPLIVLQDLLDLCHWLTVLKITPEAGEGAPYAQAERDRAGDMAAKLTLPVLARTWQMLLKGLAEVRAAPSPIDAAEMVLIRLGHAADLPDPAALVRRLTREDSDADADAGAGPSPAPVSGPRAQAVAVAQPAAAQADPLPADFEALVALFEDRREIRLAAALKTEAHLVAYRPGRLEFRPSDRAPATLGQDLKRCLDRWTGARWAVLVSRDGGQPTWADQQASAQRAEVGAVEDHALVQAVLATFPEAKITGVRDLAADTAPNPEDEGDAER